MKNKLDNVSMVGRLAYLIMCCESYLKNKYPEKDWSFVAKNMWEATSSEYWEKWTDKYVVFIPSVLFEYPEYNEEGLGETFTPEQYEMVKCLYSGLTKGIENDKTDCFARIVSAPFNFCNAYDGAGIGDGSEGYALIDEVESILLENNIPLPDYHKVEFTPFSEFNGWGNEFDGTHLSIILNK